MTFKLSHIEPETELSDVVRSFFEMTYNGDSARPDYLLPSGRMAFFHIRTDGEFQVEFEGTDQTSMVRTGYYLAYIDGTAKYVHPNFQVVAASIYPIYLGLIFRIKPKDILNTFTRLEDLMDIDGCGLPLEVTHLNTSQLVDRMQDFMLSQLYNNPLREDVETIYNKVVEAKAYNLTVGELADLMGYSHRHMSNLFQEYIGLSPKRFIQIVRFNESLKLIDGLDSSAKISDVAYEMGYHDHAHFARDFKRFCGKTPKEVRAEKESAAYLFRKGKLD